MCRKIHFPRLTADLISGVLFKVFQNLVTHFADLLGTPQALLIEARLRTFQHQSNYTLPKQQQAVLFVYQWSTKVQRLP
jgi:hypothetical protein